MSHWGADLRCAFSELGAELVSACATGFRGAALRFDLLKRFEKAKGAICSQFLTGCSANCRQMTAEGLMSSIANENDQRPCLKSEHSISFYPDPCLRVDNTGQLIKFGTSFISPSSFDASSGDEDLDTFSFGFILVITKLELPFGICMRISNNTTSKIENEDMLTQLFEIFAIWNSRDF